MRLVNQHSYVLAALLVLLVCWVLVRRLRSPYRWIALAAVMVLVVGAAAMLRTGTGDVGDVADLDRALSRGKPVALEFYSNY